MTSREQEIGSSSAPGWSLSGRIEIADGKEVYGEDMLLSKSENGHTSGFPPQGGLKLA